MTIRYETWYVHEHGPAGFILEVSLKNYVNEGCGKPFSEDFPLSRKWKNGSFTAQRKRNRARLGVYARSRTKEQCMKNYEKLM